MPRRSPMFAVVVSSFALSACSGGGDTDGGGSSNPTDVIRSISLAPSAQDPANLLTPDSAAKFGIVAIAGGSTVLDGAGGTGVGTRSVAKSSAHWKTAEDCEDGGTIEWQDADEGFTIIFDRCQGGGYFQDGQVSVSFLDSSPTYSSVLIRFGTESTSLQGEILAPASARAVSLLLGGIIVESYFHEDYSTDYSNTYMNVRGSAIDTSKAAQPRIDYQLGSSSNLFNLVTDRQAGGSSELEFSGPIYTSGACGDGWGTLATAVPLQVDQDGDIASGQFTITADGGTATYTFNPNGTVTVDTAGGSKTYTQGQLNALCKL